MTRVKDKTEVFTMSSSFDKSQSRNTQRRNIIFCSTPVLEVHKLSNISVSADGTSSSSDTKRSRNVEITKFRERKKKTKSKKQKRETKQRQNKDSDSDSDWETRSEQSVYEQTLPQDSIKKTISDSNNDVLFKDITSPERVRDAPRLVEDHLESPCLRITQWQTGSLKRVSVGKKDALPSKELPSLNAALDDTDDDEPSLTLKRECTVKTYPGARNVKKSKKNVSIEKCKQHSVVIFWDIVKNNHEKVSKYLAGPSHYAQGKRDEAVKNKDSNATVNEECKDFQLNLSENITVVRGPCNRSSRKWVRTYDLDPYTFPEPEDPDFKKDSENRPKMTLNQYLRKCRDENKKLKEGKSRPLKSQQSGPMRDSKKTTNKRRKRSVDGFESDLKRSEIITIHDSDSEMSLREATTPIATSGLKRVNTQDTNDIENANKSRRITPKNKPKIRSIELLTAVRYDKNKRIWRIT